MSVLSSVKTAVIEQFRRSESDTGSPEVQIALLTTQINELTEHLKTHPKDFHSRRGLIKMVNGRRKLMNYLKGVDRTQYDKLIKELGLRG